ncbi:MAG TPA: hypothetical protein VJ827_08945 [Rubrobacter sp.]|nr:hypothetical protein [Rubrobacter sp.]
MTFEFDHMFICTEVGAPEADQLAAFGLTEGMPNTHPGQGTACRRFFFHNAMLELVWVRDEGEARSPLVAPTRLWERSLYRSTGYSPFGICLRPNMRHSAPQPALPFATWAYRPPYLPSGLHIDVASETSNGEPMLFATPFGGRPETRLPTEHSQFLVHRRGFGEVTSVHITLPRGRPMSRAVHAVQQISGVSFAVGSEHLAEVAFDQGSGHQSADFRPVLPLRICW